MRCNVYQRGIHIRLRHPCGWSWWHVLANKWLTACVLGQRSGLLRCGSVGIGEGWATHVKAQMTGLGSIHTGRKSWAPELRNKCNPSRHRLARGELLRALKSEQRAQQDKSKDPGHRAVALITREFNESKTHGSLLQHHYQHCLLMHEQHGIH
eukprot:COSAG02_NODE_3203_length_7181_cov_2.764897_2_plen_153_part_00